MTTTPPPDLCSWCEEPVEEGQSAHINRPTHPLCLVRMIAGSVAHQDHRCACYIPGAADEEQGMSKHEAARLAAIHFTRRVLGELSLTMPHHPNPFDLALVDVGAAPEKEDK